MSKAYEVLTDDEKRRIYDRHGEKGLEQHEAQKNGGGNPFAQFFGGGEWSLCVLGRFRGRRGKGAGSVMGSWWIVLMLGGRAARA